MSVNSLSTGVSERSTPNLSAVIKPSELGQTQANNNGQSSSATQELTKPVNAGERVSLQSQAPTKVIGEAADNQTNQVNGQSAQAANDPASNKDQLLQSVQKLTESSNQLSQMQDRKLEFTTTQESGRTVVKVIDRENDDVIRQIPSEEFIRVAEKISDLSDQISDAQGLLFESKV